eukprot:TRINITY_DN1375_c1_g1_i1.p1 TRINITY_DN1375_c1_g1~~TRINITY_DN1375_c1_g1_i1.p1  ORF type:complete len:631 (-),score=223.17 TRINITY_DN1375_c1_g1_i1:81-1973(-)
MENNNNNNEHEALVDTREITEEDAMYLSIIKSGDFIWNTKFQNARKTIKPYIKKNVACNLQNMEISMWMSSVEDTDDNYNAAFLAVEEVEKMADELFVKSKDQSAISSFFSWGAKNNEESIEDRGKRKIDLVEALSVLGDATGARAMLCFKRQNYFKGANSLRKAWKFYQAAKMQLDDPACPLKNMKTERAKNILSRLKFGVGLFNYFVSMLPVALKWLVELIGFEGNRDIALEILGECTEIDPSPRCTWAKSIVVGTKYYFDDEKEDAQNLLDSLIEKYPNSSLLKTTLAGLCRKNGEIELSTKYFLEAIDHAEEVQQLKFALHYQLAHNKYLCCKFEETIPLLEIFIENAETKNFKALAKFKIGVCYWYLIQQEKLKESPDQQKINELKQKIISQYQSIPDFVREKMSFDKFALRKSVKFLTTNNNSWTELDMYFFKVENCIEGSNHDRALSFLQEMIDLVKQHKTADNYFYWVYLKGLALHDKFFFEILKQEESKKNQDPETPVDDNNVNESNIDNNDTPDDNNNNNNEESSETKQEDTLEDIKEKSITHFRKVVNCKHDLITTEKWIIPYAASNLAEIYLHDKNLQKAENCLKFAKGFPSGYDFEKHCGYKIKKFNSKLEKLKKQN